MTLFEALTLVVGAVSALAAVSGAIATWVLFWPRHAANALWHAHSRVARMAYWRDQE